MFASITKQWTGNQVLVLNLVLCGVVKIITFNFTAVLKTGLNSPAPLPGLPQYLSSASTLYTYVYSL